MSKISEYGAASSVGLGDLLIIVKGGVNKKATFQQVKDAIGSIFAVDDNGATTNSNIALGGASEGNKPLIVYDGENKLLVIDKAAFQSMMKGTDGTAVSFISAMGGSAGHEDVHFDLYSHDGTGSAVNIVGNGNAKTIDIVATNGVNIPNKVGIGIGVSETHVLNVGGSVNFAGGGASSYLGFIDAGGGDILMGLFNSGDLAVAAYLSANDEYRYAAGAIAFAGGNTNIKSSLNIVNEGSEAFLQVNADPSTRYAAMGDLGNNYNATRIIVDDVAQIIDIYTPNIKLNGVDQNTSYGLPTIGEHDAAGPQYLDWGTYTPTVAGGDNVTETDAYQCTWQKVGRVVTVFGKFRVHPTLADNTETKVTITLPYTIENFSNDYEAGGTANTTRSSSGTAATILAIVGDNKVVVTFNSTTLSNSTFSFTFSYQIIPPA